MKIAVFGKIRAGKSAVAEIIKETLEDCEVHEFSHALQDVIDVMYPQKKGIKDRELLVSVGQHMRKLDKEVWVNVIRHKIRTSKAENILVSGVRQQNEYDMLKEEGFIFIGIYASEETRIGRCLSVGDKFDPQSLNNPTELVMDGFEADYVVRNEGSFKNLEIDTKNIINSIISCEFSKETKKNLVKRFKTSEASS